METQQITITKALALIARAYLRSRNIQSWDLRPFEYTEKNEQYTRVDKLLKAIEHLSLTEDEQQARQILEAGRLTVFINTPQYHAQLVRIHPTELPATSPRALDGGI